MGSDAERDGEPDRDPIIVVAYVPAWPDWYEYAAQAIRGACGTKLVGIQHIGSTAVPGLAAKPIIDLMPLLARFEDGFDCIAPLEALGYESRGEFGIPGRHYFVREEEACPERSEWAARPREHVHMYEQGADEAVRHVLLRDYLRAHPDRAEAYAALKSELAIRFRDDRDAYTAAKSDFILETVELARREAAAER